MKYKIEFDVTIPLLEGQTKLTDEHVIRYFQSEIHFREIDKDNPLEFWSFQNCTEKLGVTKIGYH